MEIAEETRGEIVVMKLTGPQVAPLQARVKELASKGVTKVVLDLSDVQWFGSATLGVMSSSLVVLQKAGGGLRLASLTPKVVGILKVTRLLPVFNPADSVEDAIAGFSA
mgnify:FL=1